MFSLSLSPLFPFALAPVNRLSDVISTKQHMSYQFQNTIMIEISQSKISTIITFLSCLRTET